MTIPTVADIDHWRQTSRRHLDAAVATILDLVDIGAPDRPVTGRIPSRAEQEATDRADGRFEPTPSGRARRTGRSDPTGSQVVGWESQVQAAVLAIYQVVSAVDDVTAALGLTVYDEHGDLYDRPVEPATAVNSSGRLQVVEHPRLCRIAVLDAAWWLAGALDAIGDRMAGVDDPDVGDHLLERSRYVRTLLARLARQVDAPAGLRLCACGCRRVAEGDGWYRGHRRCAGEGCDRIVTSRRECERCKKRRQRSVA